MQASHPRVSFSAVATLLTVAIGWSGPFAQGSGAVEPLGGKGETGVGAAVGTQVPVQVLVPVQVQVPVQAPLDGVAPSVLAVGWSGFAEPVSASDCFVLPGPHSPAVLFQQTMLHALRGSAGAVHAAAWQSGADAMDGARAAAGGEGGEGLAELWTQRLTAHRLAAALALAPSKSGASSGLAAGGTAAAAVPVTITEGLALLNTIRQQTPDAMDTGPEARLLRAINFINARSIYISAVLPAAPVRTLAARGAEKAAGTTYTLAGVPMMRVAISWSSRSEPPELCRAVVIGETTVTATDWPADVAPGPWVLAMRPNAYYGSLGSGMGNYLRYAVAMETASRPGSGRGPENPVTSINTAANDLCGAIARAADRTFFVGPVDGVLTVLLPCRGAEGAATALKAAASLLGVKPDETTETAWGRVQLIRLGSRSIALRLLPVK